MTETELHDALANLLPDRRIIGLRRQPYAYRSSFELDELHVELEHEATLSLVLKAMNRDGLGERAQRAKPAFLFHPARELETYRRILGPGDVGAPAFYGVIDDPGWLVLEKVPGVELWQIGEFELWLGVAGRLGAMHAALARYAGEPHLLRYDAALCRLWFRQAQESAGGIDELAPGYASAVELLCSLPPTVVHGEFYPSNVLVVGSGPGLRVAPVDWETAASAPGVLDLAALSTGWNEAERQALGAAYLEGLGAAPLARAFAAEVEAARLQLAVQWLARSTDWPAPLEHRRDWRQEAFDAAERFELLRFELLR